MSGFDLASSLGNLAMSNSAGAVQASDSVTSVQDLSEHQTGERGQPLKAGVGFMSGLSEKGLVFDAVLILIVSALLLWAFGAGVFRTHNLG